MIRLFIISLLALTSCANYSIDRHHVKLGDALNFLPEVIVSETDGNTAGQMVEVTKSVEHLVNNRINLLRGVLIDVMPRSFVIKSTAGRFIHVDRHYSFYTRSFDPAYNFRSFFVLFVLIDPKDGGIKAANRIYEGLYPDDRTFPVPQEDLNSNVFLAMSRLLEPLNKQQRRLNRASKK